MTLCLVSVGHAGTNGQSSAVPLMRGKPRATDAITSIASNAVADVIANAGEVVAISTDTAARIAIAEGDDSAPDASSVAHFLVGAGGAFFFQAEKDNTRVALYAV